MFRQHFMSMNLHVSKVQFPCTIVEDALDDAKYFCKEKYKMHRVETAADNAISSAALTKKMYNIVVILVVLHPVNLVWNCGTK